MLYKRLFRVSLVALGAALALAGCQGATPVDRAEPDTVPEFSGSIANQTYKALQDIDALTLPRATGGNGDLSYSLGHDPAPGAQASTPARVPSPECRFRPSPTKESSTG